MKGTKTRGVTKFWVLFLKVFILTINLISFGEGNNIKGKIDTSVLRQFIRKFIKPYIQSLHFDVVKKQKDLNESPIQKVIRKVVGDLKPYLKDEDADDKMLRNSEETTIIEFTPNLEQNHLRRDTEPSLEKRKEKKSIQKYEKIKAKIENALDKEAVEDKTKKMVTRTLDALIAQVIGNQCTWKNVDSLFLAEFRNKLYNYTSRKEWKNLKKQFLDLHNKKDVNESSAMFIDLHDHFTNLMKKSETLLKYKIKCQIMKRDDENTTHRLQNSERSYDSCTDSKICSEELREFLFYFFKVLNDTSVSVFKNYAAMYETEVNTDSVDEVSKDINSVPVVLEKISNAIDRRVAKVFIQELMTLKLDITENKEANIQILREFVRRTCENVHKHLKKHISTDLASLSARLLLTVKKDININLGVDLGNLETEVKDKACTTFVTCNGKVSQNRRFLIGPSAPEIDSNGLYVKVQVSLDDKLKDAIVQTNKEIIRSNKNNPKENKHDINLRRYKNINVTRTTITSESTQKLSNVSNINQALNTSVV